MISFSVTPFTDFPAHHSIRSYFTRNTNDTTMPAVDISHLWSEERRREELKFDELMNTLALMAKEVGAVVISCTEDSSALSASSSNVASFTSSGCQNEKRIYTYLDRSSQAPLPALSPYYETFYTDDSPKTRKEECQDQWLNGMNARVQTLLQEAHQVLGSNVTTMPEAAETSSSTSIDEDANKSTGSIGFDEGSSTSSDIVSLYAHNESSFTSEGPTLLDDVQDSTTTSCDNAVVVCSSSGDGWLLDDTASIVHTAHTTPLFLVDPQNVLGEETCASIPDLIVEHELGNAEPLGV